MDIIEESTLDNNENFTFACAEEYLHVSEGKLNFKHIKCTFLFHP